MKNLENAKERSRLMSSLANCVWPDLISENVKSQGVVRATRQAVIMLCSFGELIYGLIRNSRDVRHLR